MAVQILEAKRRMERLAACGVAEVSVNVFPRALSEFYFASCHIPNREHPIKKPGFISKPGLSMT
jgi:hypothetical protein